MKKEPVTKAPAKRKPRLVKVQGIFAYAENAQLIRDYAASLIKIHHGDQCSVTCQSYPAGHHAQNCPFIAAHKEHHAKPICLGGE